MDSRKHLRFPVQFRSSFSSTNLVSGIGILGDLSTRGCRVLSETQVKPGTEVVLRVEISNDEPPILIRQAVVRWSRDGNFGLEFINLDGNEWVRLQRVVKELEREPFQRENRDDEAV
jgi:c-di-GMP-binding flagellar brake protein YcgR